MCAREREIRVTDMGVLHLKVHYVAEGMVSGCLVMARGWQNGAIFPTRKRNQDVGRQRMPCVLHEARNARTLRVESLNCTSSKLNAPGFSGAFKKCLKGEVTRDFHIVTEFYDSPFSSLEGVGGVYRKRD